MAKIKVINSNLDSNLNGSYFNDTPSNTIFSFGKFFVTTNFDGKQTIDYTDSLSSFVRPVTLDTLNVSDVQSQIIQIHTTNATLNLDKSNLNTFVRYGSAYEFLRVSVQNVILAYPGSLFANSQTIQGGNVTYTGLEYNEVTNISTFYVPLVSTVNIFGLVTNVDNTSIPDDNSLKNLNLSYERYSISSNLEPNTLFPIIGYTGNTVKMSDIKYYSGTTIPKNTHLKLEVTGNPFALMGTGDTGNLDFHIRPNNVVFEEFRSLLDDYERNLVSQRDGISGFIFTIKNPTLLDDGTIVYSDTQVLWATGDGYNIDVNTANYQRFLKIVLTIATRYDEIKTDLIARFLTPASLKTYDFTEDGKITKLLRLYGREFDQVREFIDSLVNINKVTYDKLNNVPDQLVKNLARTFGWDYFSLVNETELVDGFLTVDDTERNLNQNTLPAEIDVELWRRILNNTNYFWKSKGTRQAIKAMFLLIGIPEPFINITEYVYTVDGKINPNTVQLTQADFPSNSLPYDTEGYPVAPLETNDFYFQVSGNADSGQAYLDVFRMAGFNLTPTPDNKKSWIQTGATTRVHNSTPQYYQEDSRLVINTKEIDVALDTARGIEFDVYEYIQKDFTVNSSGYTLPYSYVNIKSTATANVFDLPVSVNAKKLGDFEVRYNGILLNAPSTGDTSGYSSGNTITDQADYTISGNTFTIPALSGGTRATDVIQVTFIESGNTSIASATSGITIQYIVTRIKAVLGGTKIPLPSFPYGDVQLTIDGIALTKGTGQFSADYIVDPTNSTGGTNNIIISNPDVITYLNANPNVQISYMNVIGSNDINLRSEVIRVDSFNTSKIYFNSAANKYVYKLNYKANSASDVKFLVDGIALEPLTDYNVNVMNPYEIFLPKGIRYGSVISAYYLVGGAGAFTPVINDIFGLGDISELSFLEFLELAQRKMINARNRKTVTDFKGGWYPALLSIYLKYLDRGTLPTDDPLQSNAYTFQNLYPFLNKYNAFFQRFVDQLLPATIIQKGGGLLVRNSMFTKQKHWYKRGVNLFSTGSTTIDMRGNFMLQYLGDDGSTFKIVQELANPPVVPPTLYVETKIGVIGSLITGGMNILGYNILTEYGIDYRLTGNTNWIRINKTGILPSNNFNITITGVTSGSTYEYRAYVQSYEYGYTGNTLQTTIPLPVIIPSLKTTIGTSTSNAINSGGEDVVGIGNVDWYGLQYKLVGSSIWISPTMTAGPLTTNSYPFSINSLSASTQYNYRAHMIIDGISYIGAEYTITTQAIPLFNPTVVTGEGIHPSSYSLPIRNSSITDNGGSSITEYGVIYTQTGIYGTTAGLTLENQLNHPTLVWKDSTGTTIATGVTYNNTATGLTPSTTTYYRAFAINSTCTGCGDVKTMVTAPPPPPATIQADVSVIWDGVESGSDDGLGGSYSMKCCNGTTVCSVAITQYCKTSDTPITVPYGSYYLDFSTVTAWINGAQTIRGIASFVGDGYTTGEVTNCFNSDVIALASVSTSCGL